MPWSNQAVDLIVLQEQKTGFSGMFGYSPAAGPGNLVYSDTANAGTDPYGNPYLAGTTWYQAGGVINVSGGVVLVYAPAAGPGNLIAAVAPAAGTDSYGNPYGRGGTFQGSGDVLSVIGSNGAKIVAQIIAGIPYLYFPTGAAEEASAAAIQAQVENPGASEFLTLFMSSPQGSAYAERTLIALSSAAKDGSTLGAGSLIWTDSSGAEHFWLTWGAGGTTLQSPISGDSNTYQAERITAMLSAPVAISTNAPTQFLDTWDLGIGKYHVHGQIVITPTTTGGTANFEFGGGTAAVSYMGVVFQEYEFGAGQVLGNSALIQGFASAFASNTLNATTSRLYTFDGVMNVTTAGTLGIFAGTNSTGAFTIERIGTYMELSPIGT